MSKTIKHHWTDEARLKMIEKSEFYSEPRVYQYGFYDGFQNAQSQTQELIEQKRELVEMVEMINEGIHTMDFFQLERIQPEIEQLITKHKQS